MGTKGKGRQPYTSNGPYMVKRHGYTTPAGVSYTNYTITIPRAIGEVTPEGMLFKPEITDEGILLRAVGPAEAAEPTTPKWAE